MNQNPAFDNSAWYPAAPGPFMGQTTRSGLSIDDIKRCLACAFAFLAPFNLLRIEDIYFTASDAIALSILLTMLFSRSLSSSPWIFAGLLWSFSASMLVGTLLTSSLLYGNPSRGFIVSSQYLFGFVATGYVVLSLSSRDLILTIKSFVLSIGVVCLHGIYVINIDHQIYTQFVSGSGRFLGFVERENECGALIALAIPLLLWLVQSGNGRFYWLLIGLPLLSYGITLTGSNSALIALAYAIAASVVLAGSWRQMLLVSGSAAGLYAIVMTWGEAFLSAAFQRRVLGALETGDIGEAGTFLDRVALMREAWGQVEFSMFLGIGADQYREVSAFHAPVHNVYLLLWSEAGFFGMIGFLGMFLAAILVALVAFRTRGGRLAASCTFTTTTQFLLVGNTFPHMYGRYIVVPLLLSLALSVAAIREARASE